MYNSMPPRREETVFSQECRGKNKRRRDFLSEMKNAANGVLQSQMKAYSGYEKYAAAGCNSDELQLAKL